MATAAGTLSLDDVEVRFRSVRTNGVDLHVAEAGPADGRTVVLLHGFPEFWYGWRQQIPALARSGFRVIAPDQRGYDLSDKPAEFAAYRLDILAADIEGLVSELGCGEDVTLVGHDWGGVVAWWLAAQRADAFGRLVILNVPHFQVFRDHFRRSPRQMCRSWYMFAFQLPRIPEWIFGRRGCRAAVDGMRRSSRPGTFTDADFERYREAWSQPGAWRGMIHWYRALFRARPQPPADPTIHLPTRIIWGARDRFLGREMLQPSADLCERVEVFEFPEATHWVQHEEPEAVNRLIVEFAAGDGVAPQGPSRSESA